MSVSHEFYKYFLVAHISDVETEPLGSDEVVGAETSWFNGQPTQIKSGYTPYLLQFAQIWARAAGSFRDVELSLFMSFGYIYISCTQHFCALLWILCCMLSELS